MTPPAWPQEPWSDDRTNAAFAARAVAHPTPAQVAASTLESLRVERRRGSLGWERFGAVIALLLIVLAGVGAGVAVVGPPSTHILTPSKGTSIPSPTFTDGRSEVLGVPLMNVTDAITIRDSGVDDREIAVHGWFSPIGPLSCPYTPATSPVQPVCPDEFVVLMAEPESLVRREENGYSGHEPAGPSIEIDLDDLDGAWQPRLPDLGPARPIELSAVGHFDDRRSSTCPAEMLTSCRDRFVVDRIDRVDGESQVTSVLDLVEKGVGRPFDEARAVIDIVRPDVAILSAVHVDGYYGLRRIEPTIADRRGASLVQEEALWVVRVLDGGTLATYVFVDSTGSIYELTADGPKQMAPITEHTDSPLPPATPEVHSTFSFELAMPGDRPVPIDVLDRTGTLEAAREATSKEMARPSGIPAPGTLAIANLAPDAILVDGPAPCATAGRI
jgi:hypothetical protein